MLAGVVRGGPGQQRGRGLVWGVVYGCGRVVVVACLEQLRVRALQHDVADDSEGLGEPADLVLEPPVLTFELLHHRLVLRTACDRTGRASAEQQSSSLTKRNEGLRRVLLERRPTFFCLSLAWALDP